MADSGLSAILAMDDDQLLETLVNDAYTYREFLTILHKQCSPFQQRLHGDKVKSIKLVDINNGQGYLSNIYKTSIEFEGNDQPFSVVIKIPTITNLIVKLDDSESNKLTGNTHKNECEFYELIRDVNDGFCPQVYYTEVASNGRPGFIIMDDLSDRCVGFGIPRSCTAQQFWNVAKIVAHFQAVTACKGKDFSHFKDEFHTNNYHTELLNPMIGILADYHPKFKEPVGKLMKIFSKQFSKYALIDRPAELGCSSAVHGDLWTNNILFERNPDGSVSDTPLVFIDWQNVMEGNPYFDILRFLIVASDAEIRREIQANLVEDFYNMLLKEYKEQSHGRLKPNFTLEQAHELFDLAFVDQTSVLMILLPLVKCKPESHGPANVLEAKLEKMALRIWLCMEDALEIVERRKLQNIRNQLPN